MARYDGGSKLRGLPSLRVNRVGEEEPSACAFTAYTADDVESQSGRANLQIVVILHLRRGRCERNPGYVRWNRQADPRLLDVH